MAEQTPWWRVPGEQINAYGDRIEENAVDAARALPALASAVGTFAKNPVKNSKALAERLSRVTLQDGLAFNRRLGKAIEARGKQAATEKGGYGKLAADVLGAPAAKAALIPAYFARGADEAKALAEAQKMWRGMAKSADQSDAAKAAMRVQIERDTGFFPLPVGAGKTVHNEFFKEVPDLEWDTATLLERTASGRGGEARMSEFVRPNETLDRIHPYTNPKFQFDYVDSSGVAYPKNSGAIWPNRSQVAFGPITQADELREVLAHELGSHYMDLSSPDVMRHGPAGGMPQVAGLTRGSPEWKRAWHSYRGHEGYTGEQRAFLTGQRALMTPEQKKASPFSAEFDFVNELNAAAYGRGQLPIRYGENVPFANFRAANIARAGQSGRSAAPSARAKPTADSLTRRLEQLSRP